MVPEVMGAPAAGPWQAAAPVAYPSLPEAEATWLSWA